MKSNAITRHSWRFSLLFVLLALLSLFGINSCQKNDEVISSPVVQLKNGTVPQGNITTFWGHETFTRGTGNPVIIKKKIGSTDLQYFESGLVLRIQNGDGTKNLVSSAIVKIDGIQIFGTSDFSQKVKSLTKEVTTLIENSEIEVELRSAPGSYLDIWIDGTLKTNWIKDLRDGHFYKTVKIGDQFWMAENLKATKLNNGVDIPLVTSNTEWMNLTTPGYCWYNNDETTNKTIYGAMYNWYAVQTDKLCPEGWHVPRHPEWKLLVDYLIAGGYNYDGSTTGNKIAKSLAATTNWSTSSTVGAPGNNPNANNSSGFESLPGGLRYDKFYMLEGSSEFWSGSEYDDNLATGFQIFVSSVSSYIQYGEYKYSGFSVRCVSYPDSYLSVFTEPAESIRDISVILGGDAIGGAGSIGIEKGVCYSTLQNPTVGDSKATAGSGTGSFKVNVKGLTPLTTYYARAYAIGSQGTVYGNEISFTTKKLKNKYEGNYKATGYFTHPTSPRAINNDKFMETSGAVSINGGYADLGGSGYMYNITIDEASNLSVPGNSKRCYRVTMVNTPAGAGFSYYNTMDDGTMKNYCYEHEPGKWTFVLFSGYNSGTRKSEETLVMY